MNKRIIGLFTGMLSSALLLAGCGNSNSSSSTESNGSTSDKDDRVVIYTAAEDERIAYIQEELDKKFPNTEIVIQSLGTGQLLPNCRLKVKTAIAIFFTI